jgi:hypothetical protein
MLRTRRRHSQLCGENPIEKLSFMADIPQLKVCRALRGQAQLDPAPLHFSTQVAYRLRVTSIKRISNSQQRRQLTHCASLTRGQPFHSGMVQIGRTAAMEPGDARHDVAFPICKPRNVAIADQVFRVTMMLLVTHRVPDVVQYRRYFEIGPNRHRQAMKARQLVEHRNRERRHLHGMGLVKKEAPAHRPRSINK